MEHKPYTVVEANTIPNLISAVEDLLEEGYVVIGGAQVGNGMFYQTMVWNEI